MCVSRSESSDKLAYPHVKLTCCLPLGTPPHCRRLFRTIRAVLHVGLHLHCTWLQFRFTLTPQPTAACQNHNQLPGNVRSRDSYRCNCQGRLFFYFLSHTSAFWLHTDSQRSPYCKVLCRIQKMCFFSFLKYRERKEGGEQFIFHSSFCLLEGWKSRQTHILNTGSSNFSKIVILGNLCFFVQRFSPPPVPDFFNKISRISSIVVHI